MKIGGLQKTSLLDYPENVSAIIWTVGCNFCCPFCYNSSLVRGSAERYSEKEILSFLSKRKGLLDAVVITGGEPLLQEDIVLFAEKIKKLDYLLKIDTNGSFPEKLKELLEKRLVDYVAMDVKAPKEKYQKLVGTKPDLAAIEQSIDLIKTMAPDYEFRTTVVPVFLKKEDIMEIAQWIKGAKRYYLQQFKINPPLVSPKLEQETSYSKETLKEFCSAAKPFVLSCDIRGV